MKRNFIILRTVDQPVARSGSSTFSATRKAESLGDNKPKSGSRSSRIKLKVELEQLDPGKLEKVASKKEVVSVTPAIPMRLIQPLKGTMPAKTSKVSHAWGIEATRALTSPFSGEGITVAVLDTGIHAAHPAFKGVDLVMADFTGEGVEDKEGHGTHCAGTIFGQDVSGVRIGVARGIKRALIGKVLGKDGGGSDLIASAINWAVEEGADVISLSLGIDFPGLVAELIEDGLPADLATSKALEGYRANVRLFEKLADYVNALGAFKQSAILVAAAGNESRRETNEDFVIAVSPPAVSEGFISVGALGRSGKAWAIADFSNTGPQLCGPGVDILSANLDKGLTSMSGTSMATPYVAGVAALWAQKLRNDRLFNGKMLSSSLLTSATLKGLKTGFVPYAVGSGMVQAPQK